MQEEKNILEPKNEQTWWEIIKFVLISLAIVIPIRMFIAEPFIVSGSSMVPTFIDKDYLIVDKISYILGSPHRDDVIVFKYPDDPSKYFIKRIIGLPGETIDIKGNQITIFNDAHKDGLVLDQPFIKNQGGEDRHVTLQKDEYYVLGDNRPASSDSRYWGPLNEKFMVGRVLLRLLPLGDIAIHPGGYNQQEN